MCAVRNVRTVPASLVIYLSREPESGLLRADRDLVRNDGRGRQRIEQFGHQRVHLRSRDIRH